MTRKITSTEALAGLIARRGLSRRRFLAAGGSVAAAGLLSGPRGALAAGEFDGKTIVFASWGGSYQDAQKAC
ncbi:MAG TPA: hypothetical protein VKZ91_05970 [Woeseiaceae bacterium]|nr:hypothetical protein [Woeseiaceae bacterium]